jgi:AraC family transcriptional regulator
MHITTLPHTIDHRLSTGNMEVTVLTYSHPTSFEAVLDVPAHTLSMSLSPQIGYSRGCYLDKHGNEGPWLQMGDVACMPKGKQLKVVAPGGNHSYRSLYCECSPKIFKDLIGITGEWSDVQLAAALNVQHPQIKRDLYRVLKETTESDRGREDIVEATLRIVFLELGRHLSSTALPAQSATSGLAGWQMRRITNYVESMVDHCPSVDELARLCEISPRHLTRAFKITAGCTVGSYVKEVRINKAKSLLVDTTLLQKEIAFRLGYSTPSSFSVAFCDAVGVTPNEFRIKNKKH